MSAFELFNVVTFNVIIDIDIIGFIVLHFIALCRYCVFLQRKVCGVEQISWRRFSNSICSLHVSASHFGYFCNISNFFIIIIFLMVSYGE